MMFTGENTNDPKLMGNGDINIAGDWLVLEDITGTNSFDFYSILPAGIKISS